MNVPREDAARSQLYFVVGLVTTKSAMLEDATASLFRALNGDFSLAIGQQITPNVTRMLGDCQNRFRVDGRLSALSRDAIDLLGEVKTSFRARNELVHSLWILEEHDGESIYRLLTESDNTRSQVNRSGPLGKSTTQFEAIASTFDRQQRQMNALKMAVADHFRTWSQDPASLLEPVVRYTREIVRGRFDLDAAGLPRLRDRNLAEELNREGERHR